MKYQSKKDPEIIAAFDFANEKFNTTRLIYLTGDKAGTSFDVSNSTLKRWWKPLTDEVSEEEVTEAEITEKEVSEESNDNPLNIDMEQLNQPYQPNVTPHYIPKPQSVIEYEEKKKNRTFNLALPSFEDICEMFGANLAKINETSQYVKFKDGTTMWRKSGWIDVYATEDTFAKLAESGLTSKPNKDKVRPFAFRLSTQEDFDKAKGVLGDGAN